MCCVKVVRDVVRLSGVRYSYGLDRSGGELCIDLCICFYARAWRRRVVLRDVWFLVSSSFGCPSSSLGAGGGGKFAFLRVQTLQDLSHLGAAHWRLSLSDLKNLRHN